MRNPTVETPTNRGERVKRCPNEIRAYVYMHTSMFFSKSGNENVGTINFFSSPYQWSRILDVREPLPQGEGNIYK